MTTPLLFGILLSAGATPAPELFTLREMDMHLHAGLEREFALDPWIDVSVADGRKVLVLLDHLELYRMSEREYADWSRDHGGRRWYPMKGEGHRALMADFDRIAARKDLVVFKGWEISESELDEGLEETPMRLADVIGWHISPNHRGEAPDGASLLKRIAQIKQVQARFPVPMILFHPFTMRIEHIQRAAQKAGRDMKTISVQEYRFFNGDAQERVIRELRGSSTYVEMSSATVAYWNDPVVREALIADIKPLAEGGVHFTVSTDAHVSANLREPFDPDGYCVPCGISRENANAIVRDLLARRTHSAVP